MKNLLSRFRLGLPIALLVAVLFVFPDCALAASATQGSSDTLKGVAEIAGVVIELLTFLALLMLKFFGELLGTDMITGAEAMEAIRPMWVWVRNLTNILFVGVLLFLAFSNLFSSFTGEGGNWTIKDKLPKLIIAMIAINFSLLGFKVVIDAINVGTIAILGIADHRLDPELQLMNDNHVGNRSWMKVSKKRVDAISESAANTDNLKLDSVSAGDDCEGEWMEKFGSNDDCIANSGGCVLSAVNDNQENFVCRGFSEQINDLFCRNWVEWDESVRQSKAEGDDKCIFMVQPNKFETILQPNSEPGQNLFAAFGSTFMHLERLPALGAKIRSESTVVTNTLFSAILALAFIVALIAVFIAMIARVIVLWITMVFSPLLIGASILGVDGGKGGEISGKIVTHLIMPLKVAAAFAVGFVMMSAMVKWRGASTDSTFFFGPALSQLGRDEYGFLWQIATIVLFWYAAFWAVEGSVADKIIQQVKTGAETLAGVVARSATIDRPMFSVPGSDEKKQFSMGAMLKMPTAIKRFQDKKNADMYTNMAEAFDLAPSKYESTLRNASLSGSIEDIRDLSLKATNSPELFRNYDKLVEAIKRSGKYSDDVVKQFSEVDRTLPAISKIFVAHQLDPIYEGTFKGEEKPGGGDDEGKKKAAKVEKDGEKVKVGEKEIDKNSSLEKVQTTVREEGGIDKADVGKVMENVKKEDIADGAAIMTNSNGIQKVMLVDKAKNAVEVGSVIGAGVTVDDLNKGKNTEGLNIKNIYNKSDSKTQDELLTQINSKLGEDNKVEWRDNEFKEVKKEKNEEGTE